MRDTRVEEVEHISDSDSDGGQADEERSSEPTLGIFPNHIHQVAHARRKKGLVQGSITSLNGL
jgi:hypothetical protein